MLSNKFIPFGPMAFIVDFSQAILGADGNLCALLRFLK